MAKQSSNGKITTSNTFEGGLVSDLHEWISPHNTSSDALNMELITVGEGQYMYQNIAGDEWVMDFPKTGTGEQFVPLGMRVYNSIAYILTGAFTDDGEFVAGAIGSFPSPDWDIINAGGVAPLEPIYREFHNFSTSGTAPYEEPFISTRFNFERNRFIDVNVQVEFDSSVNVIFTDNLNNTLIINSRFKRVALSNSAELAERLGDNDSNTYSDNDWDRIALIQNSNYPVTVSSFSIDTGGYLKGGGYRYFFKYTTQEGNTTEILYESPLIPISNGGLGLSKTQTSDKQVRFILTDLDDSYSGVKVYFAQFDGIGIADMELYAISYVYKFTAGEDLVITHSGLEEVESVEVSELNSSFSSIDTVASIDIINDRLALAGVSSTLGQADLDILTDAAESITLTEKNIPIYSGYSDAATAASLLGYWKGEAYEFGVVFMLTGKGLSPVFPITGMDNIAGVQDSYAAVTDGGVEIGKQYPSAIIDPDGDGFSDTDLINHKGVFRTANRGKIYSFDHNAPSGLQEVRHVTYLRAVTAALETNTELKDISSGLFFVRRKRVKNVLMQGMAVPTLRFPSKYPAIAGRVESKQEALDCAKRYCLKYDRDHEPTIGLNAPFIAMRDYTDDDAEDIFNADFDLVYVPQPSQIINTITYDKAWLTYGSIGQSIDSTVYGNSVERDGTEIPKTYFAFYSPDLEINYENIEGYLNGTNPQLEIQDLKSGYSPLGYAYSKHIGDYYVSNANLITKNLEAIDLDRAAFIPVTSDTTNGTLLASGQQVYAKDSFSAKVDRSLAYASWTIVSDAADGGTKKGTTKGIGDSYFNFTQIGPPPFHSSPVDNTRIGPASILSDTSVHNKIGSNDIDQGDKEDNYWYPYSVMMHSYSRYLGVIVDTSDALTTAPTFNYHRIPAQTIAELPWTPELPLGTPASDTDIMYISTGHLANMFKSSTGRWTPDQVREIFKYDSNEVYHTVSDRVPIDGSKYVDIFRGDGFITKMYKRTTYKNGVASSESATSADAATFGIGMTRRHDLEDYGDNLTTAEQFDEGRGLYDVGQILELIGYCNVNGDIRSVDNSEPDDTLLYGYARDFYPNRAELFGDARPDSTAYNAGYTGDVNPISYSRIEENSPSYSAEFPNRVMLSDKNLTQNYFNSFRDLTGFNYRDYGTELGRIVKIIGIKNLLLTIHPTGVLSIGIDQRTMMGEGTDIYVDNAEALSEHSVTVSDIYGSMHPESVIRTETTVAGVDYAHSAVWLFEGEKLNVISEFAIKTVLEGFKAKINNPSVDDGLETGVPYSPRVYSTYNNSKHSLTISYVAENPETLQHYHIGSVVYNTVDSKWVSRMSVGTKFIMNIGSSVFSSDVDKPAGIWYNEGLKDSDGKPKCSSFRGDQYPYEFEVTINDETRVEKLLDSMDLITNKVIPTTIEYITSGEDNDAATDIWGTKKFKRKVVQPVVTRNNSGRINRRLSIMDENAYYKNSGLYIQVGKMSYDKDLDNPDADVNKGSNKRIRDKSIRVRFIYTGDDKTFIQGIISTLSISFN